MITLFNTKNNTGSFITISGNYDITNKYSFNSVTLAPLTEVTVFNENKILILHNGKNNEMKIESLQMNKVSLNVNSIVFDDKAYTYDVNKDEMNNMSSNEGNFILILLLLLFVVFVIYKLFYRKRKSVTVNKYDNL